MVKYLLKRIGQTIITILIVSVLTFFLMELVPGDPVYTVAGTEDIEQERYDEIYEMLNLDKPVYERYAMWMWNALHLDFGKSYLYNEPVWDVIVSRIGYTLYLSILSMIISLPIGVLLGMIAAVKRRKAPDTIITTSCNVVNCLPRFWVGLLLMYFLSLKTNLLPSIGFDWPWKIGWTQHIKTLIMPLICLCLNSVAGFSRQTRSGMLDVIRQDYIRTARSKGLKESKINVKHMMRNGLIPVITVLGSRLAHSIGGSMFVENVFSIPGMGALAIKVIQGKDVYTMQAIVLLTTAVTCVAYILTDVLYVVCDPCVSLTESKE